MVERAIQSFRRLLTRLMYSRQTKNWPSCYQEVIDRLNNRVHSSIGISPNEVSIDNAHIIFKKLYPELAVNQQPKTGLKPLFKIGDHVRILLKQGIFTKGDVAKTSNEIYKIGRILFHPVIRFKLKDINTNEIITGSYNESELIPVTLPQEK